MSTGPENVSRRRRLARLAKTTIVVVAATALAVPVAGWASHQFSDVPDSNKFHADIEWMKQTGVTAGCGGTKFCPSDVVTREQMSAFMARLETKNVFLRANGKAKDADKLDGKDSTDFLGATDTAADSDKLGGLGAGRYPASAGGEMVYLWACNEAGQGTQYDAGLGCLGAANSYNHAGGRNLVTNTSTGRYAVVLEDVGAGGNAAGIPWVSAYDWEAIAGSNTARSCMIERWFSEFGDVTIDVNCFDASGAAANSSFTLLWLR